MSMEKERNDWKETIREVMQREITHNEFMAAKVVPAQRYKYEEAFASLRNALEEFEKQCERDKLNWQPTIKRR